jgi:hypothetical protein
VAIIVVLLGVLATPIQVGATEILWRSLEPRVIEPGITAFATITVVVDIDPASPEIAITTNGCVPTAVEIELIPLVNIAPNTYEATLTSDQLLFNHLVGDAHSVVGCLRIPGGWQSNLSVNVRTNAMPDVLVQRVALDAQVATHVVNLRSDELLLGSHASVALLERFYLQFGNDFDFIAVVEQVSSRNNRTYFTRRNNTLGIGKGVFDHLAGTEVPDRLLGTIIFPIDSFFDLAERTAIHEIGHQWINSLSGSLDDPRDAHWPISDLAYGIMGYSGASGQGQTFPFDLVEQPDGTYQLSSRERPKEFNDVELYLMGLMPDTEVGEHFVFLNQDQLSQIHSGGILAGPTVPVTIADIIASNGPRVPAAGAAPTEFRVATIVLSKDRLLTPAEMAFFDHMAARGESLVELPFTSGLARGTSKPFFLATGGRGTLTTTVLNLATRPVDVFILVDTSGSFIDDLPVLQAEAPAIVANLLAANPDTRVGLGRLEDYPISPFGRADLGDRAYTRVIDLTFDTGAVLSAIAGLTAQPGAGGDHPQSQLPALFQAATGLGQDLTSVGFLGASIPAGQQANFRDGATKLFLVFTDAPFHHPGDPGDTPYPGPSFSETVDAILALDPPKVIGISSGPDGVPDLQAIAAATNAFSPPSGIDCDGDGTIDVAPGDPLVCSIASTGVGIGKAVTAIIEASTLDVIDIKPESDVNPVNVGNRGVIPVAILTTETFDALQVDPSTVQFGPSAAEPAKKSPGFEDVDDDGDIDSILHFRTRETGIECGDVEASLTGQTFTGSAVRGTDSIVTVNCADEN